MAVAVHRSCREPDLFGDPGSIPENVSAIASMGEVFPEFFRLIGIETDSVPEFSPRPLLSFWKPEIMENLAPGVVAAVA
jgi:hypothetical protein